MALPQPAQKLFLIDAMSLVFRAFFAPMQMALVSPSGLPTKAIYIFLRTLRKLLKDHHPAYLAVAFATNSSNSTKPTARSSRRTSRCSFPT
jgi:DNA polymerase-1